MSDERIVAWPSRRLMWDISEAEKPLPEGCAVYIREDVAQAVRDVVIEECAAKADYWGKGGFFVQGEPGRSRYNLRDLQTYTNVAGRGIAEDIRSLKSKGGGNAAD